MLRHKFVRHWSGELTSQLAAIALVFQAFLVGLGHGADAQAMAMSPAVPGAAELVICTADGMKVVPADAAGGGMPHPHDVSRCACAALARDAGLATFAVLPSGTASWSASPGAFVTIGRTPATVLPVRRRRGSHPEVRGPPSVSA
jgi:hypothetical protein